jgi:uncharacterized protein
MKVAVTGGTGFIGGHLIRALLARGDEVVLISRSQQTEKPGMSVCTWSRLESDAAPLEGTDAIVNLAGESINQRWTKSAKERVLQSRLKATAAIASVVGRLELKPCVVVNGSGMSVYGSSETDTFDESSPKRVMDFLSSVVEKWEEAADVIPVERLVKLRVGLVLGTREGALPLMALPYKLGVGGRIGSGRQIISWIHVDDMVRLILFCIDNEAVSGPVNGVAPQPAANDVFGRTLGKVLRRPHYFPVPAFMFKLLFGEMSALLLEGQKVLPRKAMALGFTFQFGRLEHALGDIYRK